MNEKSSVKSKCDSLAASTNKIRAKSAYENPSILRHALRIKMLKSFISPPLVVSPIGDVFYIRTLLDTVARDKYVLELTDGGEIKIIPGDTISYIDIATILLEHKIPLRGLRVGSEKDYFKVLCQGFHPDEDVVAIQDALTRFGHEVLQVVRPLPSEGKHSLGPPMHTITLQRAENNWHIFNITKMLGMRVKFRPLPEEDPVTACSFCHKSGHNSNDCPNRLCTSCKRFLGEPKEADSSKGCTSRKSQDTKPLSDQVHEEDQKEDKQNQGSKKTQRRNRKKKAKKQAQKESKESETPIKPTVTVKTVDRPEVPPECTVKTHDPVKLRQNSTDDTEWIQPKKKYRSHSPFPTNRKLHLGSNDEQENKEYLKKLLKEWYEEIKKAEIPKRAYDPPPLGPPGLRGILTNRAVNEFNRPVNPDDLKKRYFPPALHENASQFPHRGPTVQRPRERNSFQRYNPLDNTLDREHYELWKRCFKEELAKHAAKKAERQSEKCNCEEPPTLSVAGNRCEETKKPKNDEKKKGTDSLELAEAKVSALVATPRNQNELKAEKAQTQEDGAVGEGSDEFRNLDSWLESSLREWDENSVSDFNRNRARRLGLNSRYLSDRYAAVAPHHRRLQNRRMMSSPATVPRSFNYLNPANMENRTLPYGESERLTRLVMFQMDSLLDTLDRAGMVDGYRLLLEKMASRIDENRFPT